MYDVIVVGARCAGSSLAMLLARSGQRVLVLDRNAFPSDRLASTHMVWHSGVDLLASWGLLDRLAATGCPPMRNVTLDLGELVIRGHASPAGQIGAAYAPRRYVLDDLLLTAARESGVDVRTQSSVRELIVDGDRVAGVRYSADDGTVHEERARLVVGADGERSTVARLVGASSYEVQGRIGGTIWAYFAVTSRSTTWSSIRAQGRMVYAWRTNDDSPSRASASRSATSGKRSAIAARPCTPSSTRLLLRSANACTRRNASAAGARAADSSFCRTPVGKGWALTGDAGLTMDAITAAGITNAFRDSAALAELVTEGLGADLDEALAGFEERRNAGSLPLYQFTSQMANLEPPAQEVIDLFVGLARNQDDADAYFGVFAQTVPVSEFFAPENLQRISAAAPA